MIKYLFAKSHVLLLTLAVILFVSSTAFGQATIVIQPGAGFNDPTPVAPVGGNEGTTLGQQRLNAFQFAASIWAATINSNVPIRVQSSWEPRPCTATGGSGGSSSLGAAFRNFPGAPQQNTWFGQALANSRAGTDLDPSTADMTIILNVNVGNPDCFANTSWYLGFDGKSPGNSFDVVAALLHELGHGLGFATFTSTSSGSQPSGFPSMYDTFLFDKVIGKTWPKMTDSERAFSATNTGNLVYRTYKIGFGDINPPTVVPVPVRFLDFLRDAQQIGRGFQFGAPGSEALLEANKVAYMLAFVQRADFLGAFPNTMTAAEFVDKLNLNAGGVLSPAERTDLINGMSSPANVAQRAAVLRAVAEDSDLKNAESRKAFVLMQYFGYLRRNPNDAPNTDFSGFDFWLTKLNSFGGNFVNAELVKAFITSTEYRQRFAP